MLNRRRIVVSLLAGACALGLFAPESTLGQRVIIGGESSSKGKGDATTSWLDEASKNHPLSESHQLRLPDLLEQLGDDSYSVREGATLELLLFPAGVAKPLSEYSEKSEDAEVKARAAWLLREIRAGDGPALAYLARITGLSKTTLRAPLLRGGVRLDEVIERIPAERMPEDIRIWGALVVAADTPARTDRIMSLYRRHTPDQPWLNLYQAMLENFRGRPESRARLIEAVPSDPPEEAIALAEASIDDNAPAVVMARRKLAERLRSSLDATTLLQLWRDSGERVERRRVVIASLSLVDVEPAVRAEWLEILRLHEEEELSEAILALACREGMTDVIQARLGDAGGGGRLFALLSTAGEREAWERLVDPSLPVGELVIAASWLPYTALLSVSEQIEMLQRLVDHPARPVQLVALAHLQLYGTPAVAEWLLERARANPTDSTVSVTVSSHAWQLRKQLSKPWDEPWWEAASQTAKANLLRIAEGPEAAQQLVDIMLGVDPELTHRASQMLISRERSLLTQMLLFGQPRGCYDIRDLMELSADDVLQHVLARDELMSDTSQMVRPATPERAAFALATYGHQPLREAIKSGRAMRSNGQLLLALFPDAEENGDLKVAVERLPEQVVRHAGDFIVIGRERAVVDSVLNLARSGTVPRGLDYRVIEASFARVGSDVSPHEVIAALYRTDDESLRRAFLRANLLSGHSQPHLDVLQGMGQRSGRQGLRAAVIVGSAASPDVSKEWLEARRQQWLAPGADLLSQAFQLVEAFLDGRTDVLEGVMDGSNELAYEAALLAARSGSRRAWRHLLEGVADDVESGYVLSRLAPELAELPMNLELMLVATSTMYAWEWDGRQGVWRLTPATDSDDQDQEPKGGE